MPVAAPLWIDSNQKPIQVGGVVSRNTKTLTASGATVAVPIFGVTGTVEVVKLYGVVTATIGANHTAGFFRLNDQTAQVGITASGVTLSGLAVGTTFAKKGLAAAAATLLDNAAGRVSEPTTLETSYFSPFVVMKKTGAATNIEYDYTTNETPTSGAITFYAVWLPSSQDGNLTAL